MSLSILIIVLLTLQKSEQTMDHYTTHTTTDQYVVFTNGFCLCGKTTEDSLESENATQQKKVTDNLCSVILYFF